MRAVAAAGRKPRKGCRLGSACDVVGSGPVAMRLCHPVPEGKARMAASFFFFLHFYCVRCMADVLRASHSAPFGANRSLPCGVAAQPVRRGLLQELVMGAHASAAVILFAWCINTHSLWQSFEVRSRKAA